MYPEKITTSIELKNSRKLPALRENPHQLDVIFWHEEDGPYPVAVLLRRGELKRDIFQRISDPHRYPNLYYAFDEALAQAWDDVLMIRQDAVWNSMIHEYQEERR